MSDRSRIDWFGAITLPCAVYGMGWSAYVFIDVFWHHDAWAALYGLIAVSHITLGLIIPEMLKSWGLRQ